MPGEEKTGSPARLRRQAEASGGEWRFDLDLPKGGDEGLGFQSLFQGPGRVQRMPRLNDEKKRRIEAESEQAWSVRRAPFARGSLGQAPQER